MIVIITKVFIVYVMDSHHQVDLILLDFTKAFDTVPHKRLLTKLHYYSIYMVLSMVGSMFS